MRPGGGRLLWPFPLHAVASTAKGFAKCGYVFAWLPLHGLEGHGGVLTIPASRGTWASWGLEATWGVAWRWGGQADIGHLHYMVGAKIFVKCGVC